MGSEMCIRDRFQGERWYDDVAIIGIYGPHFREKPSIAGRMCSALGRRKVDILGISTSFSSVSCVINNNKTEEAKEAILSAFDLP